LKKTNSFKEYKKDFLITKYNLAIDLMKNGKTAESEKMLKSIMDDDNNFYGAYVDYAKIFTKEKRIKKH